MPRHNQNARARIKPPPYEVTMAVLRNARPPGEYSRRATAARALDTIATPIDLDGSHVQVLVAVVRGCKPNSPYPERAWLKVKPLRGVPEFGNALSALIREGFLCRKHGFRVKPSPGGYDLFQQWKAHRRELKRRPILFDQIIWQPRHCDSTLGLGQ